MSNAARMGRGWPTPLANLFFQRVISPRMPLPTDQTPLYVDLDGTLIASDLFFESAALFIRQTPWKAPLIAWWLLKGRAHLKAQLARRVDIKIDRLPYRRSVLEFLKAQKKTGRRLILATGSNVHYAEQVAKHLGLFDAVLGSDNTTNRSGRNKLLAIQQQCPNGGFSYIGDSRKDLILWKEARQAFVVNHRLGLLRAATGVCTPTAVFEERR
jgi:phosphoserine phosphatase